MLGLNVSERRREGKEVIGEKNSSDVSLSVSRKGEKEEGGVIQRRAYLQRGREEGKGGFKYQ